mgnify:CR=1 FL=1
MDTSKRCVIVATIDPLEDKRADVKEILTAIIPEVHRESGCDFYALHEDTRGRLIFIEAWDSREQWVQHTENNTVAQINAQTDGLLRAPIEVLEMYAVPSGGPQGVVPSSK